MKEKLTFQNILDLYEANLDNLRIRLAKGLITKDFFDGAIDYNSYWFHMMKYEVENGFGTIRRHDDITQEEKEKYDTDKDFPLIYMIDYRGETFPVYSDDYGQQDFAKYNGEDISGGSYNFCPEIEFTSRVDQILEAKFLNTPVTEEEKKSNTFFSELIKQYEAEENNSED